MFTVNANSPEDLRIHVMTDLSRRIDYRKAQSAAISKTQRDQNADRAVIAAYAELLEFWREVAIVIPGKEGQ